MFIDFDVLVLDGEPIIDQPYAARRQVLEGLDLPGVVVTPAYPAEDAPALFGACEEAGMEGLDVEEAGFAIPAGQADDRMAEGEVFGLAGARMGPISSVRACYAHEHVPPSAASAVPRARTATGSSMGITVPLRSAPTKGADR